LSSKSSSKAEEKNSITQVIKTSPQKTRPIESLNKILTEKISIFKLQKISKLTNENRNLASVPLNLPKDSLKTPLDAAYRYVSDIKTRTSPETTNQISLFTKPENPSPNKKRKDENASSE